jgi:hypothetical protein
MENVRYTPKRLGEILGVTPKQVTEALGRRDGLGPQDLATLVVRGLAVQRGPRFFPA